MSEPGSPPVTPSDSAHFTVVDALRGTLFEELLALLAFVLLGLVVFAQFTLRYVFDHALPWGEELARMLLIIVVFAGSAAAAARRSHICIDGASTLFGPRWGPRIGTLGRWLSAGLFAVGAALAYVIATRVWNGEMATLPISRGWIFVAVSFSFGIAAVRCLRAKKRSLPQ